MSYYLHCQGHYCYSSTIEITYCDAYFGVSISWDSCQKKITPKNNYNVDDFDANEKSWSWHTCDSSKLVLSSIHQSDKQTNSLQSDMVTWQYIISKLALLSNWNTWKNQSTFHIKKSKKRLTSSIRFSNYNKNTQTPYQYYQYWKQLQHKNTSTYTCTHCLKSIFQENTI